jgi:hypothetical protein
LYTVRNRHYDPVLGRWITRDPAGYVDGMDLFEYAQGSPSEFTDAFGLDTGEGSWLTRRMYWAASKLEGTYAGTALAYAGGGIDGAVGGLWAEGRGGLKLVRETAYTIADGIGMGIELGSNKVFDTNLHYQPVSVAGKSSDQLGAEASWEEVHSVQRQMAERAVADFLTLNGHEIVLGLEEFAKTGDYDALSEHMGGVGAGNLLAAFAIARAGAPPVDPAPCPAAMTGIPKQTALARVADFATDDLAIGHFEKHSLGMARGKGGSVFMKRGGADMPEYQFPTEYRAAARAFMNGEPRPGVVQGTRANGEVVRFEPATGKFGVMRSNGTIKTYFRPNGTPTEQIRYFEREVNR